MDNLAPWRSLLARAQHRHRSLPQARYVQLATVRPNGRPANRTIVFRGFLGDSNQLQFVTDARSPKPAQIDYCAWGEVCWYFPKTREQFRFHGRLALVTEQTADASLQAARHQAWQKLSSAAQAQFLWPAPGQPRNPELSFPSPQTAPEPVAHFCLLLLDPASVDHLELTGNPQHRHCYEYAQGVWQSYEINP
ncbi:Npun_F5749 family FMN-dependent PPOX-type flavoprotein [Synechocystis sp. LKSZ1]|uniref:Npun_F5749 family FMN-dependent PPOX-type flavoprotein n=1 Tax=Synechocystis sp. LKSZ1 TaxID=3144951 RepID=UPI00336C2639